MLVLSRKKGEKVVINESITVEVIEIKNTQIRLGFEADKNISIRRSEVAPRIGQVPISFEENNRTPVSVTGMS